jgi:hypothetical protein
MTTIITKNGNGIPPSLEVGELAIDKSEPALYTNTGSGIEKIGGSKSGGGGGGFGGVAWWSSEVYKNEGAYTFIKTTINGANQNIHCGYDQPDDFGQIMGFQYMTWVKGDSELLITPTARGGNTVGIIPTGCPEKLTRSQIFVDGELVYDDPIMFKGQLAGVFHPNGFLIGREIKIIWTLSESWSGLFNIGRFAAGIS